MQPDLNRLRVFFHIYSHGSVIKACQVLGLSQPAVSQHLQKLEAELEVPLFTRLHKKLVPTQAGDKLYNIVAPFMKGLQNDLEALKNPFKQPSGNIRFGAPPVFGMEYFPNICSSFRNLYPEVCFSLALHESAVLLESLKKGAIDFALIDIYFSKDQLFGNSDLYSFDSLVEEELNLVCSKTYYDNHIQGDHSFERLSRLHYISDEIDNYSFKTWFKYHFKRPIPQLNIVMTINSHQAMISATKLGTGISITASHMVLDEIQKGEIIPIRTKKKAIINQMSLVQLQDKVPSLTEKTFIDFLKEELQKSEVLQRFVKISD